MATQKTNPLFQQVTVLTEQIQETLNKISQKTEVESKKDVAYTDEQAEQLIAQKNEVCEEYGYTYKFNRVHGKYILANRVTANGQRARPTVFLVTQNGKLMASKLHRATTNGKVVAK